MNEVKAIIVQAITAAGGSIGWDALLAEVPENLRRHFIPALKTLEAEGTYKRQVTATPTGATFAVVKAQAV